MITDNRWRLANLYSIKRADTGQIIPFRARKEQQQVIECLASGHRRIIIIKARRLGMSTAIGVYSADAIAFNSGYQVSIVDRNQAEASLKLSNICKVAFESLPRPMRDVFGRPESSQSHFQVQIPETLPSAIYAGKNARGGTNQIVHISEWGVIQWEDPPRSAEILTGALPSAEHGTAIIETTWKGGRGGDLWTLVRLALKKPQPDDPTDWKLFFFPWWQDATYVRQGNLFQIDSQIMRYLKSKEEEIGVKFSDEQKVWYANKREEMQLFMFREFPTTFDECFRSPIEGAIYADRIDRARLRDQIKEIAPDASALVHTFWDIGAPRNTVVLFAQVLKDGTYRILECESDLDITPIERVARIFARGYHYGGHFLPHDSQATMKSGKTFYGELLELGLSNLQIVQQAKDPWIGINHVRAIFDRFQFRIPACERLIEALSCYHKREASPTGLAIDEPSHDWSSHYADALRVLGDADMHGMIPMGGTGRHQMLVHSGSGEVFAMRSYQPDPVMEWWESIGSKANPRIKIRK